MNQQSSNASNFVMTPINSQTKTFFTIIHVRYKKILTCLYSRVITNLETVTLYYTSILVIFDQIMEIFPDTHGISSSTR